ncbi:MAG: 1-(5-phosphoribosyl)-5-[(5-phosphoribosylamino)methylideneamino] imidazole-4-carboxamide isomerase [Steroidobacteraceae bacterium]
MRLIPAIDLRAGRCVRLRQGNFGDETTFDIEPLDLLERYAAWGADWVHVVDLDGARDGSPQNQAVIASLLVRRRAHLQIGGGLRTQAQATGLIERGAARIVLGSLAATAPREVRAMIEQVGADRVTIALDVRIDSDRVPRVAVHGWRDETPLSLWDAIATLSPESPQHVLCTDVARDGLLSGPNLELYAEACRRFPGIEWQASGGIRNASDLAALATLGVAAAVSGRALIENRIEPRELKPYLPNA